MKQFFYFVVLLLVIWVACERMQALWDKWTLQQLKEIRPWILEENALMEHTYKSLSEMDSYLANRIEAIDLRDPRNQAILEEIKVASKALELARLAHNRRAVAFHEKIKQVKRWEDSLDRKWSLRLTSQRNQPASP